MGSRPAWLYAGNVFDSALERLGADARTDRVARVVEQVARIVPARGHVKDALTGTWLGHALHPMLTDLPIGFWTSAFMFDLLPGEKYDDAARALIGMGVLSAIPTALAGAADWSDTEGPARRVGAVHAVVNASALALYAGSWSARQRGHRAAGIGLAMGGATLATVGGYLGGHLMGALGIGIDRTAFDTALPEWTPAGAVADLADGPIRVQVAGGPAVVVVRRGEGATAVSAVCPHRGAPLEEGEVHDDAITCPWHGSEFSLNDGSVRAGPSPAPVRAYEARVIAGRVEVRDRPR